MAIVDPNPNLAPSYEQVQQALQQRAKLELAGGGSTGLGLANAIATPIQQQQALAQQRQFELAKNYQSGIMDIAKSSSTLGIPDGATFQDIVSGRVQPTLQPKVVKHTVTQEDIDQAVKDFGIDESHKSVFDDLKGKEFTQKDLEAVLIKRARFMEGSNGREITTADFRMPDGSLAKGYFNKKSQRYFLNNGVEAPAGIEPINSQGAALGEKQKEFDEKKLTELEKRLDPTQRRAGALADAQKRVNGIQRLQALFDGYANDLTPQEWEEASLAWASILGAGGQQSSRSQIEALVPKTLRGNVKAEIQWLTNNPTGTDQQAFAKRVQQGMQRELKVNSGILKESQKKGISGFQDVIMRNPDQAKTTFENYGITPEEVADSYPAIAKKLYPDLKPIQDFKTIEEAEKANLPPGTRIRIAGKKATVH